MGEISPFWPKNYGEKSGLKKHFLNFFMRKPFSSNSFYFTWKQRILYKIKKIVTKMAFFPHERISKIL